MRTSSGFTLIELLVVIAIIAILAAILFPVFAQARAKARQANCNSNVKQIVLAIRMYCDDNDEVLPFEEMYVGQTLDRDTLYAGNEQSSSGDYYRPDNYTIWPDQIMPYIENEQLFVCPETQTWLGYGWNTDISYFPFPGASSSKYTGRRLVEIDYPSQTLIVVDTQIYEGRNPSAYRKVEASDTQYPDQWIPPHGGGGGGHHGGFNIGYVDGHVKWQNFGSLKAKAYGGDTYWIP